MGEIFHLQIFLKVQYLWKVKEIFFPKKFIIANVFVTQFEFSSSSFSFEKSLQWKIPNYL